jgi:hypothetical protein
VEATHGGFDWLETHGPQIFVCEKQGQKQLRVSRGTCVLKVSDAFVLEH